MSRYRLPGTLVVLVALLVVVAGCRTATGRSAGTWIDDQQITAKVKTAIATAKVGTLTRVDVDARDGVVYLTGNIESREAMQDILAAARTVPEARSVVNNLQVAGAAPATPAASPRTTTEPPSGAAAASSGDARATITWQRPEQPARVKSQPRVTASQGQQVAAIAPAPAGLRFSRVEPEATSDGSRRFAAHDASGKQVATVHTVPASTLTQDAIASLDAGKLIDHVSIYPHPGMGGAEYHVVLWHVDRNEAARMR